MKSKFSLSLVVLLGLNINAQQSPNTSIIAQDHLTLKEQFQQRSLVKNVPFKNIGPTVMSGRVTDLAVNPENSSEFYVGYASGGVWHTINNGTTFTPILDNSQTQNVGDIAVDWNTKTIWVGTGENNGQRSVAYGDGVYKSTDGGASWTNMGLKSSEHIGNIVVHPDNSDVVYVSSMGPLWSAGGERGVYKTTDGGKTWKAILTIDKHTGVNEIHLDPRNPEILYATSFQRRRHVFTYLGGGPESGIHKSTDGGATWTKINSGLPSVDKGRITLDISPADPDIIYAMVEAAQGKGGTYRSTDGGASWHKRGGYSTSGNYYQEIYCDPHNPNKLFAMDTWMKYSIDGGMTFKNVGEDYKHVDNHSIWINPQNTDHLLVGCDGGIYETFDHGKYTAC